MEAVGGLGAELFNDLLGASRLVAARSGALVRGPGAVFVRGPLRGKWPGLCEAVFLPPRQRNTSGISVAVVCLFDEVERVLPFEDDDGERRWNSMPLWYPSLDLSAERRLAVVVTDVHPDCNRSMCGRKEVRRRTPSSFFQGSLPRPIFRRGYSIDAERHRQADGKSFDDETLRGIIGKRRAPFLARQLASLVCRENSDISDSTVRWSSAQRPVEQPSFMPDF